MSGDLFLSVNQRRKGCKVSLWDGTGICIFMKRLEGGRFADLCAADKLSLRMTASELAVFIRGCSMVGRHSLSPAAYQQQTLRPAMRALKLFLRVGTDAPVDIKGSHARPRDFGERGESKPQIRHFPTEQPAIAYLNAVADLARKRHPRRLRIPQRKDVEPEEAQLGEPVHG